MPENAGPVRPIESSRLRPHHVRSVALAGAVVGVVVLPIAAAQATPSQNHDSQSGGSSLSAAGQTASGAESTSPVAQAVASEFCGTATNTKRPDGSIRTQACVFQNGGTVLARLYVSNGTSTPQVAALNLTQVNGDVVQVQCVVAAGDSSAQCATSPVPVGSGAGAFNAVAELVGQNAPVSAGLIHVESGLVAPQVQ